MNQFRDEIYHSLNLIKLNTLKYLSASQDHDSAQWSTKDEVLTPAEKS